MTAVLGFLELQVQGFDWGWGSISNKDSKRVLSASSKKYGVQDLGTGGQTFGEPEEFFIPYTHIYIYIHYKYKYKYEYKYEYK